MMLVMIVATMFMRVIMFSRAAAMRVAAPILMTVIALVRLLFGIVLRMAVAALVTARIFMVVIVFVSPTLLVSMSVFVFICHIFLCRLLKKAHLLRCARLISRQRTRVRLRSSICARLASEPF
jgi:hypothetical protein